jgi:HAMP domain-containing protein
MERPLASSDREHQQDWWWIFDPRLSLRARAALIFGGSAALFTLLFSGLAGTLLHRVLERQAGATFETLAFQVSDKLDRVIYTRYHELQLAAGLGPFRTGNVAPIERRRLLEAVQETARDFAWLGFADDTGRVTAATHGVLEGTAVDSRPWYRAGRERAYVAGLNEFPTLSRALSATDEDHGTKFIDLAVPVQSTQGQFLGVLGAHVFWDWAREVQVSVVPEAARRERIGVTVYASNGDIVLDSGSSGWTQPPDMPVITEARKFRGNLVEPTTVGTTYVTGFARSRGYHEYRGLGWLIVVRQPADLTFAPARELQRQIGTWGFVFTIALLVVSWFATERLTRRLRMIRLAADRIRQGDVLTVMPRPRDQGEMAQMCGALGAMVEDFRARQHAPAEKPAEPSAAPPPRL